MRKSDQVILSLAVNAVEAVEGSGEISFRLDPCTITPEDMGAGAWEALPGPHVRLTVADSGTGMSPEVAEEIFEPFFTTKSARDGTGLGLSTVLGIVKQGCGHLLLTTDPPSGRSSRGSWSAPVAT